MVVFMHTGATGVVVFLTLICLVGGVALGATFYDRRGEKRDVTAVRLSKGPRARRFHPVIGLQAVGVGLIPLVVFYAFNLAFSASGSGTGTTLDNADVAAALGLQSDHSYPLVLGDRLGGASGTATARAGFFSARASVNIQPASMITVSFTHANKSYMLDLPTSKLTFVQS